MGKLYALFELFRQGNVVADPALWKKRQITATILLPLFVALVKTLKAFGLEVPIDDSQLAQLVVGIVVLINVVFTITTTDKIGLPPRSDDHARPV